MKKTATDLPPLEEKKASIWTNQRVAIITLLAFMIGIGIGSLTRSTPPPVVGAISAAPAPPGSGSNSGFKAVPPEALQASVEPMLAAVKTDPKNVDALISLANLYYDHKKFAESIEYYQRALEIQPKNVDARTDLGTVHWYLGDANKAIKEYEKALADQPDYPQTLMNLGIVRMEGLKDREGALAAWRQLLKANPGFSERQRVEQLIAKAEHR